MRKTVFITGASSGIGEALAKIFAENHHDLILTARNEAALNRVAKELSDQYGVKTKVIAADLSHPNAIKQKLAPILAEERVDICVNNAGFGLEGPFAKLDLEQQLGMVNVNVSAVTHITHLVLPQMLKRKSGKILNVSSTAAFQPGPYMAVYFATKAYIVSFSEAIAEEVRDSGVTVTTLCPGPTETAFTDRAGVGARNLFTKLHVMSAEEVARKGYEGLMNEKRLIVPGEINALGVMGSRYLPRRIIRHIMRSLSSPD